MTAAAQDTLKELTLPILAPLMLPDVSMTKKLQLICSTYNVLLCDHVIYAPNGIYSFYHEKQLQGISSKFSLSVLSEEVGNGKREEK